jgi:hypothetical protein
LRRRTPSLSAATLLLTAALSLGAAVFARPAVAFSCAGIPLPLATRVQEADLVVLGTVTAASATDATIIPVAFLKGPAQAGEIVVHRPPLEPECPLADIQPGTRVLAMISSSSGTLQWPEGGALYLLRDGQATSGQPAPETTTETALVQQIRGLTNQYAVPAASNSEGASLDWLKTVVPVSLALLVVFGIGLYLMRIWHRIDPS